MLRSNPVRTQLSVRGRRGFSSFAGLENTVGKQMRIEVLVLAEINEIKLPPKKKLLSNIPIFPFLSV